AIGDVVLADRLAVHADPLAERDEVRRGVEPDAAARGFQDGRQRRRDGPFPVGAGDLDQLVAVFRVAERSEQGFDALEAGAHARVLAAPEREEPRDGLAIGHESAKNASSRRTVSRSSRRSTIASIWPCSSRNSDRWKPSGSGWRIVSAMTRGPANPISA